LYRVVFIRHGQSIWNKKKIFTGWTDVDLSPGGIREAKVAASILRNEKICFDIAFTSYLKKAIRTLWIVLDRMDLMWIPVHKTWRLNERHYGALQGLSKPQTARRIGKEKVMEWRRGYYTRPPELEKEDDRFPGNDPRYSDIDKKLLPAAESLKDVQIRVMKYWENTVVPQVRKGRRVLISSHGNTLRSMVMHFDNISTRDVKDLNIPTGIPFTYEFDDNFNVTGHHYHGEQKKAQKAAERVAGELG